MDITELRFDLDAWARWKTSGEAMPNACNLGRLADASGGGVPGSRPPAGVEINPRLAALMEGMEILPLFRDIGEPLMVVRVIYLRGKGRTLDDCAEALNISRRMLDIHRRTGESALMGWLIAKGF